MVVLAVDVVVPSYNNIGAVNLSYNNVTIMALFIMYCNKVENLCGLQSSLQPKMQVVPKAQMR